jgi:hypothetical protein
MSDKGIITLNISEVARAIMEKFHILSYKNSIWEYRHGIYVKSDTQTHEEIVKIYKAIGFSGSITSKAKDIIYCIINDNHTLNSPFNKFCGIPVENGVVEINFETGTEKLIPYSPDMMFSYKLPVKYDRSVSTDTVMKLLRTWVHEKDLNTLIQIPAQAILQKIFLYTYKKFYLFNGARDSGKSSFTNFLTMTLSIQDENDPKYAYNFTKNYTSISLDKLTNNTFAKS